MSVRKRTWTTGKGVKKEAWVVDYVDQGGVRRLKTFERKKAADDFSSNTAVEVRKGEHVADSATVTIKEAGRLWLGSAKSADLERATVEQYRQHLDLHIVPFIGADKLSKVSVPFVRAFQDRLREKGRSPAMVKRVTVSLGGILSDAQERGLAVRNAVREMASRRKKSNGERRQKKRLQVGVDIPTPAEIRAILEHATGRWRPFILTAIFTGLRASELRGLRWQDVDLKAKRPVLHVRQRADRYHVIGMPKSDAGQRTVPLPPIVANTLKEWKVRCPKGDLVFPNGEGNIEFHQNIINRGLKPTLLRAGVSVQAAGDDGEPAVDGDGNPVMVAKYTGLHALRHFYASWCINPRDRGGLELTPKDVQDRMGHSSITMTMDVYGHLFPAGDDSRALAAAERALLSGVNAT